MSVPATQSMTVPEFLAWAESQEKARYELVHGQILAMAPERSEHVRAKRRAADALDAAIKRAGVPCEAFVEGLAVCIDQETSYIPDAPVNCGDPVAPDSMIAPAPMIVVEVLSPSTQALDKSAKLADYFRVPGLAHYLIIDLVRRHVVHYGRRADGVLAVNIVRDGDLLLDPPGISVSLSELLG
jgi:Uma2 family endonuclease